MITLSKTHYLSIIDKQFSIKLPQMLLQLIQQSRYNSLKLIKLMKLSITKMTSIKIKKMQVTMKDL